MKNMKSMKKTAANAKKNVKKVVKKTAKKVSNKMSVNGKNKLKDELKKLQVEYSSLKKEIKNSGEDKAADMVGSVSALITNIRRRIKPNK